MANKIKLQQKFPLQFGSFLTITFVGELAFVLQRSSSNGKAWKDNTQKSYHSQIPYQYFQLFPIQNSNSGQILIFLALIKRLRSHKNILVQEQRYKQYLIRNLMKISVPFIWCKKSASVRHYCHCIAGRLSCSNGYRQCLFTTEGTEFFCVLSIYHRNWGRSQKGTSLHWRSKLGCPLLHDSTHNLQQQP